LVIVGVPGCGSEGYWGDGNKFKGRCLNVLLNLLAGWRKDVLRDELLRDDLWMMLMMMMLLLWWGLLLNYWASVVVGQITVTIIVPGSVVIELELVDEGWQGRGPDRGVSHDRNGGSVNGRRHRDWDWCGRRRGGGVDDGWWWD
jgi:hypothetical protein